MSDAGAVDGGAPAQELVEFISRFLPLHNEGNEVAGACPFHDGYADYLLKISTAGKWRCAHCCSEEVAGNDNVGFYACWTNSTRAEAAAALGNGAGLPDVKLIEQVPLKRLPFWGWRYLDKPELRDKAVWIHELSGAVLVWRELVPERAHLGLITGRPFEHLEIVAPPRRCVLAPEANPTSRVKMQRLAAALYYAGHAQVMCLDLGIDERFGTRLLPPAGLTAEEVLKWAKARSKPYPHPNAAPQDNRAKAASQDAGLAAPSSGSLPNTSGPAGAAPALPDTGVAAPQPIAQLKPAQRVQAREMQARAEVLAGLVYTCLADVRPEAVKWLWPGRIPLGELTMIVGDPGLGKSQICCSLASVVTNGGQWPVDRNYAEQGSVLILSAEDNLKHTIRPRLDAANADVSRCHTLQAVKRVSEQGTSFEASFNLAEDLAKLSVLMDELRDVRMVVIDPVSAYLGETDSHKNAEVRGMLAPLTTLAGSHNAAIILVSHLTKSQSANALMRVQGSIAFAALCRAVWGVTADKDNRQRRLFMPLKNNLGQDKTGLAYAIEGTLLEAVGDGEEPIPTSRVMWESELVQTSVDEAFGAALSHEERSEMDDAKDFLREVLSEGRVKASEVQRAAKSAGHSSTTLQRAKKSLRVTSERDGFGKDAIWYWRLDSSLGSSAANMSNNPPPEYQDGR